MNCPRCGSSSVFHSHGTTSCLPCGHVLAEPALEAWDLVASHPGAKAAALGPAWTDSERQLWDQHDEAS